MPRCLFSISTSGIFNDSLLNQMCGYLSDAGIETRKVDSLLGWWNLNQDWYEFEDEAETDWGWVRPKSLSEEHWEQLWRNLNYGVLLMQVHYIKENGDKRELIPHH
jgi:hypothetical protein